LRIISDIILHKKISEINAQTSNSHNGDRFVQSNGEFFNIRRF